MPETKRASFRLTDEHRAMVDEIAAVQGGLTKTRVVEWAIERLHSEIQEHRKKTAKMVGKRLDVS